MRPLVTILALVFSLLTISHVTVAAICTSTDQRPTLEHLDCFCSPAGSSSIEKQIRALGSLADKFKIKNLNCSLAVATVLATSTDKKINEQTAKQLTKLGFSADQSEGILKTAQQNAELINIIGNVGISSHKRFAVLIGFTGIKVETYDKRSAEIEKLSPEQQLEYYHLSNDIKRERQNNDFSPLTAIFKKIEHIQQIGHSFEAARIEACLKITDDIIEVDECLTSPSENNKILACKELGMVKNYTMQCLRSRADAAQARACKNLNLIHAYTLECLDQNTTSEVVQACGSLNFLVSTDILECTRSGATVEKISSCNKTGLSGSKKLECIKK